MTRFDPDIHHRRTVRLKGWNYSWIGGYWLTLCVEGRECIFGDIVAGEMHLNVLGIVVAEEWARTPSIRPQVELDQWVVMPNHLHGIIMIANRVGLPQTPIEQGAPTRLNDPLVEHAGRPQVAPTDSGEQGAPTRLDDPLVERAGRPQVAPTDSGKMGAPTMPRGPERGSIGAIIGGFKAATFKRINDLRRAPGAKVWQRSFYDHVIRDEKDLEHARTYIFENPANWETDENHPSVWKLSKADDL